MADSSRIDLRFVASETHGNVSATLWRPSKARALFVLAHGAGADMRHTFMESLSEFLFERDIATFRYQFPYKEAAKRRPDPASTLQATVRRAVVPHRFDAARAGEAGKGFAGAPWRFKSLAT